MDGLEALALLIAAEEKDFILTKKETQQIIKAFIDVFKSVGADLTKEPEFMRIANAVEDLPDE